MFLFTPVLWILFVLKDLPCQPRNSQIVCEISTNLAANNHFCLLVLVFFIIIKSARKNSLLAFAH